MSLNSTPSPERIHIGFFGKRNVGKSSVVNAVTGQNLSVVSDVKGTTTDPVFKAMELLPLGPVSIVDTAGIDDEGELGTLRIEKTKEILRKVDIAVLVVDACVGLCDTDKELIEHFKQKSINYIIAYNKSDLVENYQTTKNNEIYISAKEKKNIYELKELIATLIPEKVKQPLLSDVVFKNQKVILVTPIDSSAPKGRLILPQQQVIRELLEIGAITTIVQLGELKTTIDIIKPDLVITDSQVFNKIKDILPKNILLTSFSILFARYKGILKIAVSGVTKIDLLKDGDTILISEGCTHHRQCEDIGTVKLPKWIKEYTKKELNFEFTSGTEFPEKLDKYSMIIHCGGCTLNDREVLYRYNQATEQKVPISNYGITIAYINGILRRSIELFSDISKLLQWLLSNVTKENLENPHITRVLIFAVETEKK